jgi:hypothetical protein
MLDLINRYGSESWSGREVSREDAALIEAAVYLALVSSRTDIFHFDLIDSCRFTGWESDDAMTLWTVALYANVFPVLVPEAADQDLLGRIHFSIPDVALGQSQLEAFWGDRDLVCLALKRQAAPGKDYPTWQRPGARPYRRS